MVLFHLAVQYFQANQAVQKFLCHLYHLVDPQVLENLEYQVHQFVLENLLGLEVHHIHLFLGSLEVLEIL